MSSLTTGASAGGGIHLASVRYRQDGERIWRIKAAFRVSAGPAHPILVLVLVTSSTLTTGTLLRWASPASPTQFQTSAMFCATLVAAFLYTFSAVALLAHGAAVNEAKRGQSSWSPYQA